MLGEHRETFAPRSVALTHIERREWQAAWLTVARDQRRGELLPRNACRNPWQNLLNARLAERVHLPGGQNVELSLDVINVLHLLDSDWGNVRRTGTLDGAGTENVPLLRLRGRDASNQRNSCDLTLPRRNVVNPELSRWRLQLGARYSF